MKGSAEPFSGESKHNILASKSAKTFLLQQITTRILNKK